MDEMPVLERPIRFSPSCPSTTAFSSTPSNAKSHDNSPPASAPTLLSPPVWGSSGHHISPIAYVPTKQAWSNSPETHSTVSQYRTKIQASATESSHELDADQLSMTPTSRRRKSSKTDEKQTKAACSTCRKRKSEVCAYLGSLASSLLD